MRPRRPFHWRPSVHLSASGSDALLGAGLLAIASIEAVIVVGNERPAAVALVPALALPLVWRRSRPSLALLIVTFALVVQLSWQPIRLFDQTFTGYVCLLVSMYAHGRHSARAHLFVGAACSVVVGTVIAMHDESFASAVLGTALCLASIFVGRTVLARVTIRSLLDAQARELEVAAQASRDLAVTEVRARIVAELQDGVGRRVRHMVTQAQEARQLVNTAPDEAATTSAAVESNGRAALDDMRRTLGVLRLGQDRPPPDSVTVSAGLAEELPRAQGRLRRADPVLVVVLIVVMIIESVQLAGWDQSVATIATTVIFAVAASGPLLVRRSAPLLAAAVGWSGAVALASLTQIPTFSLMLVIPLYGFALGAHAGSRGSRAGLLFCMSGVVAVNVLSPVARWGDYVFPAIVVAMAWLAGTVVREHTHLIEEARARDAGLKHTREMRAEVDRAGECLRISRELHDILAHTLMVMVVQAGAARRTLESGRAGAGEALTVVEETGRDAAAELGRLLALTGTTPEHNPLPGLGQLDSLVARSRAAGLDVDLTIVGDSRSLPAGIELTAYRLVQESLTNVLKHAKATHVEVRIAYERDRLVLGIIDNGRARLSDAVDGTGNGIVGMRERVRIYDGELTAEPQPGGGFGVSTALPLEVTRMAHT